jgi:hypothetical protein
MQPSSVNAPQALEDVKRDGIIAVEKSLELKAWHSSGLCV